MPCRLDFRLHLIEHYHRGAVAQLPATVLHCSGQPADTPPPSFPAPPISAHPSKSSTSRTPDAGIPQPTPQPSSAAPVVLLWNSTREGRHHRHGTSPPRASNHFPHKDLHPLHLPPEHLRYAFRQRATGSPAFALPAQQVKCLYAPSGNELNHDQNADAAAHRV